MGKGFSPIVVAVVLIAATVAASTVLYVQIKPDEQPAGKTPIEQAAPAETVQQPAVQPKKPPSQPDQQPPQFPSGQQPGQQQSVPGKPQEIPSEMPPKQVPPQPDQQPVQPLPDILPPFPDQPAATSISTAPTPFPGCMQLDSARNDINGNSRINIVLVGVNYASLEDFREAALQALDVNGNSEGFFSVEPFKSNRNMFNILYVSDVLGLSSPSASFNFDSSAAQRIRERANKCNYQNKYTFIMVNTAGNIIVPNIGETSGVGNALPPEHAAITRFPYPASDSAGLRNNKGIFIHENGGHEIGGLYDEYVTATWVPSPQWVQQSNPSMLNQCFIIDPQALSCTLLSFGAYNCNSPPQQLVDQCAQNAPWHDLIGNGCGRDGIIDCSENDQNYPLEVRCWQSVCALNSFGSVMEGIMSNHNYVGNLPRSFGQNNERLICRKIKEVTGSVGGSCNNLCIDGCPRGQRCAQGACQSASSQSTQTPSNPTTQNPDSNMPPANISTSQSASLNIISPNGGETIQKGTTQTIRWSSNGIPSNSLLTIILRHIQTNAYADYTLKTNALNDGTEDVVFPAWLQDGNYKINIKTAMSGNLISDLSDGIFAVSAAVGQGTLSISPSSGTNGDTIILRGSFLTPANNMLHIRHTVSGVIAEIPSLFANNGALQYEIPFFYRDSFVTPSALTFWVTNANGISSEAPFDLIEASLTRAPAPSDTTPPPAPSGIWMAPSNAGVSNGINADFKNLFLQDQTWTEARRGTNVFKFYAGSAITHLDSNFIRTQVIPKLRQWNMRMAFEVTGGTNTCGQNTVMNLEMAFFDKIIQMGGRVDYLVMDSPLYVGDQRCPNTPTNTNRNIAYYIQAMKQRYPWIKIGITDPLPLRFSGQLTPSATVAYQTLAAHLQSRALDFDFIQIDNPYDYSESRSATYGSWEQVKEVEDFVKTTLRKPFGLIYNTEEGGSQSNALFYSRTIDMHRRYALTGGQPDHKIVQSWYPYPTINIPEDSPNDFPFTKTLRDFIRATQSAAVGQPTTAVFTPTLTSISPASFAALTPATVTFVGTNFRPDSVIVYSGAASGTLTPAFDSSTQLRFIATGGFAAGNYQVSIRNPGNLNSNVITITVTA